MTDPLSSLRLWPIQVELAGQTYTIPPLPATAWFVALLKEDALPVVPGLLDEAEQLDVIEALAYGVISLEELTTAARDALEVASGWRWWAADRMIRSAAAEWKIVSGQLINRGVDLDRLPLGAVLNSLYTMAVEGLDQQKRTQFDIDLNRPPAGAMSEEEREEEAERMMAEAMREAQTRG